VRTEATVLEPCLAIVAPLTKALVVLGIAEELSVAAVRLDVICHDSKPQPSQARASHAVGVRI